MHLNVCGDVNAVETSKIWKTLSVPLHDTVLQSILGRSGLTSQELVSVPHCSGHTFINNIQRLTDTQGCPFCLTGPESKYHWRHECSQSKPSFLHSYVLGESTGSEWNLTGLSHQDATSTVTADRCRTLQHHWTGILNASFSQDMHRILTEVLSLDTTSDTRMEIVSDCQLKLKEWLRDVNSNSKNGQLELKEWLRENSGHTHSLLPKEPRSHLHNLNGVCRAHFHPGTVLNASRHQYNGPSGLMTTGHFWLIDYNGGVQCPRHRTARTGGNFEFKRSPSVLVVFQQTF